jgi:hypothetical protein
MEGPETLCDVSATKRMRIETEFLLCIIMSNENWWWKLYVNPMGIIIMEMDHIVVSSNDLAIWHHKNLS